MVQRTIFVLKQVVIIIVVAFESSSLDINVSTMNKNLKMWYARRKQMEAEILEASSEEEKKQILHKYHMWEWNFPHSLDEDNYLTKSERAAKERAAHELEKVISESEGNHDE